MQTKSALTPQRTKLLEEITANAGTDKGYQASSCFLGVRIENATRLSNAVSRQVAKQAGRKLFTVVKESFPGITFQWLDDAHGMGLVLDIEEAQFRVAAKNLLARCQLDIILGDDLFSVHTQIACTWFPAAIEASSRFLLDTAEQVLTQAPADRELHFVTIASQEDAIEALGRCVDLLSDLGLSQRGNRLDRRENKRLALIARCIVRYFRAGTTDLTSLDAETHDVSHGGFALHVSREFRTGDVVEVELRKADGSLFVAGAVTHCRYVSVKRYQIGITALETLDEPIISSNPGQAIQTFSWLAEFMRLRAAVH